MVAGKRAPNSSRIGRPVWMDVPRSPLSVRCMKRRYWMWSGWSSPSARSTRATFSAVARSPSIATAGLPGMRWMNRKTITETPSRTGISESRRRRT